MSSIADALRAGESHGRYKVYILLGDTAREATAGANDDLAKAITAAIQYEAVGIYGRTLVQDSETGDVMAAFQDHKPLDPSKLDS
jgi:hypothetical protein